MRRKLAVIMSSDVAGYSRLVAADENDTIARFTKLARTVYEIVAQHDGRVFNSAGDAILAEFDSAVSAVRAAVDIQDAARSENKWVHPDRVITFRIGIAVGDVIVATGGDLLGDGVNVAARLQTAAEPGGICVSAEVHAHVASKVSLSFIAAGEQNFKNLPHPIPVYRVALAEIGTLSAKPVATVPTRPLKHSATRLVVLGASAVCVALAGLAWWLSPALLGHATEGAALAAKGRRFEPERVPFVSDETRRRLSLYPASRDFKAIVLALNGFGIATGMPSEAEARQQAFAQCRRIATGGCELYALGDFVVWPRPAPTLLGRSELRTSPLDGLKLDLERLLFLDRPFVARWWPEYARSQTPKAIAIGARGAVGFAFNQATLDEAIRRALERCGDVASAPCIIYGIGDAPTQPLPTLKPISGVFTLGDDPTIPYRDRARLAAIYEGADWRVLAKGGGGSWHAVSGSPTEGAAIEAAIGACEKVDRLCAVVAIGSFRVDLR